MCLWADPAEVIPCLCSNRRRPGSQEDIMLHFETGIILLYVLTNILNFILILITKVS